MIHWENICNIGAEDARCSNSDNSGIKPLSRDMFAIGFLILTRLHIRDQSLAMVPPPVPTLWLGCAHFRTPEYNHEFDITHTHRNLGNIAVVSDDNLSFRSTLELFLLDNGSRNIVLVGHTKCQALRRALQIAESSSVSASASTLFVAPANGGFPQVCYIDDWLQPIVELARENPSITIEDLARRNVEEQVDRIEAIVRKRKGGIGAGGHVTIQGSLLKETLSEPLVARPVTVKKVQVQRRSEQPEDEAAE